MRRDRSAEAARLQSQRAAAEQREREEAERRRQEEAAAQAAAEQAAFDALPESEKALRQFEQGLADLDAQGAMNKERYPALSRLINTLSEQAQAWPDAAERQRAADAIKKALDRFGWSVPGVKADKRKKQQAKRQQQIDAVIQGHA
jgi:CRISPR-associated protein Cmr6